MRQARSPALAAEVEGAFKVLDIPGARLIAQGEERPLLLEEVEALLASSACVVDACRHAVRHEDTVVSLAGRPVLFALVRALAEAWPDDARRDTRWMTPPVMGFTTTLLLPAPLPMG